MLLGALVTAVSRDRFRTMSHADRVAAVAVAEAGVADVVEHLIRQPDFDSDLINVPGPAGRGTYTVRFHRSGPSVAENESVNNRGTATVEGPRGPTTVPPGSVDLVVEATVGSVVHRIEVLLIQQASVADEHPLMATGNIYLSGDLTVDSVDGLLGTATTEGSVHSNSRPGTVEWTREVSGDQAFLTGAASCSCTQSTSVNFQGTQGVDYFTGGPNQRGARTRSIPSLNVAAAVADMSTRPTPSINSSGPTVLTAGEYFLSGTTSIPDNLVLEQGAYLFVDGDLDVAGTVEGAGRLMVDGDVELFGGPFVAGGQDHFVSVFAQGNLKLKGHNAVSRMESLAATDTTADALVTDITTAVNQFQAAVTANDASAAEAARMQLGEGGGAQLFAQLRDLVAAQSANDPTQRFLEKKFDHLSDFYGAYDSVHGVAFSSSNPISDAVDVRALVDEALQRNHPDLLNISRTFSGQITRQQLGAAHLRGFFYSSGALRVENGVSILGALVADNGTGGGTFENYLSPVDGATYAPSGRTNTSSGAGTIRMKSGSRLTIDQTLYNSGTSASLSPVRIAAWLKR